MVDVAHLCLTCMTDKGTARVCTHCGSDGSDPQRSPVALPQGTLLNERFVIGRVLGNPGGFGVTYLAWDRVLETAAAIKEFLPLSAVSRTGDRTTVQPNSTEDAAFFAKGLDIFTREARTLAQFAHPNIVRIRDCFNANATAYLVMDYHQGLPLDQLVRREGGQLSENQAKALMLPILDGLQAVHDKGFLHRDIKPQNIYVTDQGTPILLDFGAARMALAEATKTMTVMLSAGFAPFEQYHSKGHQGPWSDVYGCAATLYLMVTGKVPFDAIERRHSDKLLPPMVFNAGLGKAFSQAIMQGLAVEPLARPQTVAAFREALSGTPHIEGAPTVVAETVSAARAAPPAARVQTSTVILERGPPTRGTGRWLLALVLLGAAAGWWMLGGETVSRVPQTPGPTTPPQPVVSDVPRPAPAPSTGPPPGLDRASEDPFPAPPAATLPYPPDRDRAARETAPPATYPPDVAPAPTGASVAPHTPGPGPLGAEPPRAREADPSMREGQRPQPPAFAFDACRGRTTGSRCEIPAPRGTEPGRCEPFAAGRLACIPDVHRERRGTPPPFAPLPGR